jgi:hypothetical protein
MLMLDSAAALIGLQSTETDAALCRGAEENFRRLQMSSFEESSCKPQRNGH